MFGANDHDHGHYGHASHDGYASLDGHDRSAGHRNQGRHNFRGLFQGYGYEIHVERVNARELPHFAVLTYLISQQLLLHYEVTPQAQGLFP